MHFPLEEEMIFKNNKYNKIDDLILDSTIVTTLYDKTYININIEETKEITLDYSGKFFDVLGASFDMINGIVYEYLPDLDYDFWRKALYDIKSFDEVIKSRFGEVKYFGNISFKVDKTQYIDMNFSSNVYSNVKMLNFFIEDFCKKYNIDKKEYFEYLDGAHKYFVDGKYSEKMHRKVSK